MEHENSFLWEVTAFEFVLVTVLLAGAAAFMTGRAVASTWNSNRTLLFYILLLAAATRFIHYALFQGTLLSPYYYLVDLIVLLAIAFAAKRITRARQMVTQYGFKFEPAGIAGWTERK